MPPCPTGFSRATTTATFKLKHSFRGQEEWPNEWLRNQDQLTYACMHLHLVLCSLNLLKILSFHSAHQLQPNPLHQLTYSSTYNKSNAIYSTLSVVYFRYLAEKVLMYHHVNVYPIPRHKSRGWQTFTTCSRSTAQKQKLMLWYGHQH